MRGFHLILGILVLSGIAILVTVFDGHRSQEEAPPDSLRLAVHGGTVYADGESVGTIPDSLMAPFLQNPTILVRVVNADPAVATGTAKLAMMDLRGKLDPGYLSPYDLVVVSSRLEMEQPGVLARIPGKTLIYYSSLDAQAPNTWTAWDYETGHYEVVWTQAVEANGLWLTRPETPRRQRGRIPAVLYWDGPPPRYVTNVAHPRYGAILAETIWSFHHGLEAAAGRELGIFLDNTLDQLPGRLGEVDWTLDGVVDRGEGWRLGLANTLATLRARAGERTIIGNGQTTLTAWLNGRWVEQFGADGRDERSYLEWEPYLDLPWRKPVTHVLNGSGAQKGYALAVGLVRDDSYAGFDVFYDGTNPLTYYHGLELGIGTRGVTRSGTAVIREYWSGWTTTHRVVVDGRAGRIEP